jgi:arylsulfatase A-like enzyme
MNLRCLAILLCAECAIAQAPRHLIVIAIDTLRADHLGCYGYDRATSPTLDALAQRGMLFERAIATAPWTLPSFASMFSGRMPTRHGASLSGELRLLGRDAPAPLSSEAVTLTEVLARQGFRCAAVTSNPYLRLGLQRGFAEFFCDTVDAERIGGLSRAWIETCDPTERNFLFVHFNDPHEPTDAPGIYLRRLGLAEAVARDPQRQALERWGEGEAHLGRAASAAAAAGALATKIALYDATILQVDLQIARILEALEARDMLALSLLVVVSDHGEEFLDHVEAGRSLAEDPRGLFGIGHGHSLYDELLRVPLLVVGGGLPADQRIAEQFSLLDLMPTLLGLLELAVPAGVDGVDRASWLLDESREDLPAAAESIAYGVDRVALLAGGQKLIADRFGRALLQFDLRADPAELKPLPSISSQLLAQLVAASDAWAQGAPAATGPAALDPQLLEGLRALGYVE